MSEEPQLCLFRLYAVKKEKGPVDSPTSKKNEPGDSVDSLVLEVTAYTFEQAAGLLGTRLRESACPFEVEEVASVTIEMYPLAAMVREVTLLERRSKLLTDWRRMFPRIPRNTGLNASSYHSINTAQI